MPPLAGPRGYEQRVEQDGACHANDQYVHTRPATRRMASCGIHTFRAISGVALQKAVTYQWVIRSSAREAYANSDCLIGRGSAGSYFTVMVPTPPTGNSEGSET